MSINCMVVDDEPIARDILTGYIEKIPGLNLVKSCMNATEAYEGLYQYEVHLLLLDIEMPVITGTDFLKSLRKSPLVIFTTAYSQFAVEGFELNAIDYLLKPITFDRFYHAIQKVKEKMTSQSNDIDTNSKIIPDYIFIKQDKKLLRVNFDQIDYIIAEKDFSSIYMGEKRLLASMHLKIFENLLPQHLFIRVHRSYIINLTKIKAITGNMIELNDIKVPIGANYREPMFKKLGL